MADDSADPAMASPALIFTDDNKKSRRLIAGAFSASDLILAAMQLFSCEQAEYSFSSALIAESPFA
ncbi:MAG: hypothetical protein NTX50_27095 [Candidatus Sumerlaeota bacterium]|nr:hypothetical protein [Candidatus Sumerlaeota bacterium]